MEKEPLTKNVQRWLLLADNPIDARVYIERVALFSLVPAAVALLFGTPLYAVPIVYTGALLVGMYIPKYMAKKRAEKAEAEIPYAFMAVASLVDAGADFEVALKAVQEGEIGKAFQRALSMYKKGIPLDRALRKVGESYYSESVRRAFNHLAALYNTGKETTVIKRMAEDLTKIQEYEAKRFTAKLAVYSLVYIAVAALIPSLYLAYTLLSTFALGTRISTATVYFVVLCVFPLVTGITLAYMYVKTPVFMRGNHEQ